MTGAKDQGDAAIWSVGVFDAHCHPTDIQASIKTITNMKAKVLTVMSTRPQDQDLVLEAAKQYPSKTKEEIVSGSARHIIPAFGWHPWFSYQLYDDRPKQSGQRSGSDDLEHYKAVLIPSPNADVAFLKSLPKPTSLSQFLSDTERRLQQFPLALVGEVGLDRSFRLPVGPDTTKGDTSEEASASEEGLTPGTRDGRALSPYRVNIEHQKLILLAQLELAARYQRPVSVHSVQTHGIVFELLQGMWKGHEKESKRKQRQSRNNDKKGQTDRDNSADNALDIGDAEHSQSLPYPPRICMHSYSGPPEALKQFLAQSIPAELYFSFSICINFSHTSADKVTKVIEAVPEDRILIESDLHRAGDVMDRLLLEMLRKVCEVKGWSQTDGARMLKRNWERFVFGN